MTECNIPLLIPHICYNTLLQNKISAWQADFSHKEVAVRLDPVNNQLRALWFRGRSSIETGLPHRQERFSVEIAQVCIAETCQELGVKRTEMPPSQFSTSSMSSDSTVADQTIQESRAQSSFLVRKDADMTNAVSVSPRKASTSLPLRRQLDSTHGKRPAEEEKHGHRSVRAKTVISIKSNVEGWMLIDDDVEAAGSKVQARPYSIRRERRVRVDSNDDDSKTDGDADNIVVKDSRGETTLETSMNGSKPSMTPSCKNDVSDEPMIWYDVSMATTHPASNNYNIVVADLKVNASIARLTTESISTALVGVGAQFAAPTPFMRVPADDWIMV